MDVRRDKKAVQNRIVLRKEIKRFFGHKSHPRRHFLERKNAEKNA